MDTIVHQLLTRLNMFFLQELDFQVDILRFATAPEYAAQVLDLAIETGHGEMGQLARQIRERQLQLFSLHPGTQAPDTKATPAPGSAPADDAIKGLPGNR